MTAAQGVVAALALVVVAAYAALAVRWTASDPEWYASLPRPSWQPPDLVFGVVWPLNFGALGVAGIAVALERPPREALAWVGLLVLSVAPALGWAREFYVSHRLGRSAALLAAAAVVTWALVVVTGRQPAWAGWVLVPYAVWLTIASSLAVDYRRPAQRGPATVS